MVRTTVLLRWVAGALVALAMVFLADNSAVAKYAAMVVDADTGAVLHAANPDSRNYPASLTKMMTLYMVFQKLDGGQIRLTDKLTVSARAAGQAPSRLGLKKGQTITVKDAILALVTKSANDVAVVVAENLAKTEPEFAVAMTNQARKLGMSQTTFRNASGLFHGAQMSTARDMAILARALLQNFSHHYHYFSTAEFVYRGVGHRNHNKLLGTYDGTDGIKTGYLRASGFNLVASAKRDGRRLIGVVFGGRSPAARNRQMVALLDKAFEQVGAGGPLLAKGQSLDDTPTLADAGADVETEVDGAGDAETEAQAAIAPVASDRWGVQVGAYNEYTPALRSARKAVKAAPAQLGDGIVKVVPLKRKRGGTVYRARVLGLSKEEAYRACRMLKRKGVPCMELTLKDDLQVASTER